MQTGAAAITHRLRDPDRRRRSAADPSKGHYRPAIPFHDVVDLCTQRLATNPRSGRALLQRARAEMHLGRFTDAVTDLNRVLSVANAKGTSSGDNGSDGDDESARAGRLAEGFFYRGCCHAQLGQDEAAIADFTEALAVDPEHKRAAYARAAARNRLGDFAGAIEDYECAFSHDAVGATSPHRRDGSYDGWASSARRKDASSKIFSDDTQPSAGVPRRPSRSQFAAARLRGESVPEYLAALQSRQRERQAHRAMGEAGSHFRATLSAPVLHPVSANVSASTSEEDEAQEETETRPFSPLSGASGGRNDTMDGTLAQAHGEWSAEGAGAGMSAMDPASLSSHGTSFYSLSDFSEDEEEGAAGMGHSANAYVQRGLYHRKRGELQEAINMYSKALEVEPNHFKAIFNRAFCYDKMGRLALAIADYEAAARVEPGNAYTYYNLGISCDRVNDLPRAVKAFTAAIEKDAGQNPDFHHNRGFSRRKMGDYHGAIEDYSHAIALKPMHFKSRFNRGFCYDRVGAYDRAVEDYTVALRVEPRSVNALHNRGIALEKLGRLREALEDFDAALAVDPKSGYTRNARGLLYEDLEDWQAAIADFDAAIQLQPLNASFLYNRGYAHRSAGHLTAAIEDYTACLAQDAGHTAARNSRAFAYRKLDRYDEAIADYTAVIAQYELTARKAKRAAARRTGATSGHIKALNNRAYCLARVGRFPEAIEDYSAVLALDATNTHALHNRAISFEKTDNLYAAIDDLTQLIAVNTAALAPGESHKPSQAVKRGGRGDSNAAEDDRAAAARQEALSAAYYSRGTTWQKLQRTAEAARDFTASLDLALEAIATREGPAAADEARQSHPAWQALEKMKAERLR